MKDLPTQKIPGSDDFTGEFTQTFKKEIMSTLHKLDQH